MLKGWVLYDADCRWCRAMARRTRRLLAGRRLELLPLQTPWVKAKLGLPEPELLEEMRLLQQDGKYFGGADAVLEIGRYFWWAWPLRQIGRIPAVTQVLRVVYRWIARNRNCATRNCTIKRQSRLVDFLPLTALPCLALLLRTHVTPWIFMWALAFALYGGCKCSVIYLHGLGWMRLIFSRRRKVRRNREPWNGLLQSRNFASA
jgi:predicted DCC family thiol-disulfide oxidoreductase YuxK